MNKEFTFIIHGPYNTEHIKMCGELRKYGYVILSTTTSEMDIIQQNKHLYDKIVLEDVNVGQIYNHGNIYLHTNSVINGLSTVTTKYTVKLRIDHSYSNIKYLVEKVKSNVDGKFLCSNITINTDIPYHFCDTIIAGTTELMSRIFYTLRNMILTNDFIEQGIDGGMCAELFIFASYLRCQKIKVHKSNYYYYYTDFCRNNQTFYTGVCENYKEFIKREVELIDVSKMSPYNISFNTGVTNTPMEFSNIDELAQNSKW